jgi:hypothetical protein
LSRELPARGFVPIPASQGGYSDFPLVGFWSADHPLARLFERPRSWNLFPGFNDV